MTAYKLLTRAANCTVSALKFVPAGTSMFSGGLPVTRSDTTPVSAAVFVITDHAFNLTSAEVRPDAVIVPMLPFSCVAVATLCTTAICPAWYPCVAVSVRSPACVVSEATARTFEIAAVGALTYG